MFFVFVFFCATNSFLFFRCDEIYREFSRSELKGHERRTERRMVMINLLERTDRAHDDNEKRIELGVKERKKKCDQIFLSSAPIKADMLPFQGFQGDQVVPIYPP